MDANTFSFSTPVQYGNRTNLLDLFDGAKGEVEEGAGQPTIDKLEELRVPVCAGGIRMKVSACIGKKITLTLTQHWSFRDQAIVVTPLVGV